MSIRDLFYADFGFDLPISGRFPGLGTRKNPIVIHSSYPVKIVETMYSTVHGMNLIVGSALTAGDTAETPIGILWQPDPEKWLESYPREKLYSVFFQRKELRGDESHTQNLRYYFRPSDYHGAVTPVLEGMDFPSVSYGGIRLPVAIGSLHHVPSKSVDYAQKRGNPNLGVGYAYEAVGIIGTIYIYPVPDNMEVGEETLQRTFELAASEVEAVTKNITPWLVAEDASGFMERAWMMGKDAEKATALGIGITKEHFVKYRLTWLRNTVIDQEVGQFMESLYRIITN